MQHSLFASGSALLAGLAYGLLLGPLFLVALRQVSRYGPRAGAAIWTGAFSSDVLMMTIGIWWSGMARQWFDLPSVRQGLGWLGGCLLLVVGGVILRNRPVQLPSDAPRQLLPYKSSARMRDFMSGFTMNLVNIANALFWLGAAAAFPRWTGPMLILAATIPTMFFKQWACVSMSRRMNPVWFVRLMHISGALLIVLGAYTLYSTL
jgi:threonine/homoserine/homoserine lactone efflux protein